MASELSQNVENSNSQFSQNNEIVVLKQTINGLKEDVQALRNADSLKTQKLEELQSHIMGIMMDNSRLVRDTKELENAKLLLLNRVDIVEKKNDTFLEQVNMTSKQMESITNELTDKHREVETLKNKLESNERETKDIKDKIQNIHGGLQRKEIDAINQDLLRTGDKIKDILSELEEKINEIQQMKNDLEMKDDEIQDMKNQRKMEMDANNELSLRVEKLEPRLSQMLDEFNNDMGKLNQVEKVLESVKKVFNRINACIHDKKGYVEEWLQKLQNEGVCLKAKMQNALTRKEIDIKTIDTETKNMKRDMTQQGIVIKTIDNETKNMKRDLTQQGTDINNLATDTKNMKRDMTQQGIVIKTIDNETKNMKRDLTQQGRVVEESENLFDNELNRSRGIKIQKDCRCKVSEPSFPYDLNDGQPIRVKGYRFMDPASRYLNTNTGVYDVPVQGKYRFGGSVKQNEIGELRLYLCSDREGRRHLIETTTKTRNWTAESHKGDMYWFCEKGESVWLEAVRVNGEAYAEDCTFYADLIL